MNTKLNLVKRLFHFGLWSFVLCFLGIIGSVIYLWLTSPEVAWLQNTNPRETAMMQYRAEDLNHNDHTLQRKWKWVELSDISPHLVQAVIIVEDQKFFQHKGFDWDSIQKAFHRNIKEKKIVRGGSTITQQLAKNLFLAPSRNFIRKIREAMIVYHMEEALTKNRIMELYLNVIEWGPEIYGIEAASQAYFQKSSDEISISEAIRLASVLSNPYRFSPLEDKDRRMQRKRYHISMFMLHAGSMNINALHAVLAELDIAIEDDGTVPLLRRKSRVLRRLSGLRDTSKDTHYDH
jgi:monofunctional biosynthetic peptidoglycan transglycosylase